MLNNECNIEQAIITLSDEIVEIQDNVEKVCLLTQTLVDEYFGKFNEKKEEDKLCIWWEFPRYATYAGIIRDYIYKVKGTIDKLTEIEDKAYERRKIERMNNSEKTFVLPELSEMIKEQSKENQEMLLALAKGLMKNQNID